MGGGGCSAGAGRGNGLGGGACCALLAVARKTHASIALVTRVDIKARRIAGTSPRSGNWVECYPHTSLIGNADRASTYCDWSALFVQWIIASKKMNREFAQGAMSVSWWHMPAVRCTAPPCLFPSEELTCQSCYRTGGF